MGDYKLSPQTIKLSGSASEGLSPAGGHRTYPAVDLQYLVANLKAQSSTMQALERSTSVVHVERCHQDALAKLEQP